MAQIIKHRRGSLEGLSAVTSSLQKGELLIATGSSNITASNGASLVFAAVADGQIQAVNRFLQGNSAPNTFSNASYNGLVNGVPYYDSGSSTLYLLGSDTNTAINLLGNIQPFSTSVDSRLDSVEASLGGGGSIGTRVSALEVASSSLNSFTSSQLEKNSTLATYTGSVNTILTEIGVVSGSLISSASAAAVANANQNSFTQSAETRFTEIGVVSGSLISSASAASVSISNLNTFSGSQLTQNTALATVTGSLISSASNANTRLTDIEGFSSSFDTAFNLSGTNVEIAGNLTVKGTTTQVESTTIQLGDNIIELNGTGAANGGLLVKDPTAPNTVSGSLLWDSTNDYWKAGALGSESKLLRADGDGVISGSSQVTLQSTTGFSSFDTALATITGSLITSASAAKTTNDSQGVSITNLNTTSASVNTSIENLNSFTSSNNSTTLLNAFTASAETRFTEIGVVSGSLITSASAAKSSNDSHDSRFTTLATYTGSVETRLTEIGVVSGSLISSASAAAVANANLNTHSGSVLTILTEIGVVSGSLISSASAAAIANANLNTHSGSVLTRLTEIGVVSGSLIVSASAAKTTNDSQDVSITNLNSFTQSANSRLNTLEGTGTIQGVGTSNNVTFAKVTTSGDVVVGGDLVVQGNTVTLNTATLIVEDKLITLASGSTSSATADGAGFEVAGAAANFVYQHSTTAFTSSIALIAPALTASINLGSAAGSSKRVAFRNTNGNLDLVPTASVAGDLLQWDGSDFVMSNVIDGGSF